MNKHTAEVRVTRLVGHNHVTWDRVQYTWPSALYRDHPEIQADRFIDVTFYRDNGNVGDFVDHVAIVLPSTWLEVVGVIAEYHEKRYGHLPIN